MFDGFEVNVLTDLILPNRLRVAANRAVSILSPESDLSPQRPRSQKRDLSHPPTSPPGSFVPPTSLSVLSLQRNSVRIRPFVGSPSRIGRHCADGMQWLSGDVPIGRCSASQPEFLNLTESL
jgi:hypothetical protein